METTIRKWGNSAGVIVPQVLLKDCNLSIGESVDIRTENGSLLITKLHKDKDIKALTNEILSLTSTLTSNEKKQLMVDLNDQLK